VNKGIILDGYLQRVKQVIDERYYPRVIVTDRDLALVGAVRAEFPDAHKLLCRWHIQQNILKFCRNKFTDGDIDYDSVKNRWDWMVKAPTFESFERRYQRLQELLVNHQGT
jgi:transposase-like protein